MGDEIDRRWGALFADLSGQFDAAGVREREAEQADRARYERGRLDLAARLRAAMGQPVRLGFGRRLPLRGVIVEVGPDWVALSPAAADRSQLVYVRTAAVSWIEGLGGRGRSADRAEWRTPDLRRLLRGWSADLAVVTVELVDGGLFRGRVKDVFADTVDVAVFDGVGAEGPSGEFASGGRLSFPLSALLSICAIAADQR